MSNFALNEWWNQLSAAQRAILRMAVEQRRLDFEPVAQLLADTGCPVRSVSARWAPVANRSSRMWVMPEFLPGFISVRV